MALSITTLHQVEKMVLAAITFIANDGGKVVALEQQFAALLKTIGELKTDAQNQVLK